MNKFIGITILIIGLIASVIEIFKFVDEKYPDNIKHIIEIFNPPPKPEPLSTVDIKNRVSE
jgi:hypothetical protein